jgi:hypothetical protein
MRWEVRSLPEFDAWFESLERLDREAMAGKILALEEHGPLLRRPHADTVVGSKHANMKELRARSTLRALYAFDDRRRAVLLIGGDKRGDPGFYDRMIRRADVLFDRYRARMRAEGDTR